MRYTSMFYYNFSNDFDTTGTTEITTPSFDCSKFEQKIACDGQIFQDNQGLIIDSSSYTISTSPGIDGHLDHIKWLTLIRDSYPIENGEFIYEAQISAQQQISPERIPSIYRSRIRNINEDYRLCCSGIVVTDPENNLNIKILLTNDWIYGYYERSPKSSLTQDYAAFTSVIPLCKRNHDDYVQIGIGIDVDQKKIKFYINHQEIFCIPRIGYRLSDQYQVNELGGTSHLILPNNLKFGFGHFTFMDHHLPNNYARQHIIENMDSNGYPIYRSASGLCQLLPTDNYRELYPDFTGKHSPIEPIISFGYTGTDSSYLIFGQGMTTRIKYLAGYTTITPSTFHDSSTFNDPSTFHDSSDDESHFLRDLLDKNRVYVRSRAPVYQDQDRQLSKPSVQSHQLPKTFSQQRPIKTKDSSLSSLYRKSKMSK